MEKKKNEKGNTKISKVGKDFKEIGLNEEISLEDTLRLLQELKAQNEELRKTQVELDSLHDKYFDLYNFAPIGYLTLNEKGIITEVNLTAANLLGATKSSILNKPFANYILNEDQDKYYLHNVKMIESEVKQQIELRLRRGNESYFWARVDTILSMREKDVLHNLITLIDITEEKIKEEALRESEERFRKLFQDVKAIAVQGYSKDCTVRYWNKASEELYGYSENEAIGKNLLDLIIPPELINEVKKAIQYMAETGNAIPSSELTLMRKDGSRVSVYSSHAIVKTPGQEQEFFCIDIDITERKKMETALRETLEKLNRLYNNTPAMLHSIDKEGRLLSVSDYWLKTMGYEREEVIGRQSSDFLTAESKRFAKDVVLPQFMRAGFCNNIEYQFVKKNGEIIDTLLSATSEKDEKGRVLRSLAVITDITERKKAEEALRLNNEMFDLFMKHSPIYAFIKEVSQTESRVLKASENFEKMVGISGSEMEGKNMYELFSEEFAAKITEDDWSVVSNGKELKFDEELDGRYYTSIKFPIFKEDKSLLAGYTIDITERKLSEEKIHQSEEKYRVLHETLMDAFVRVDNEGFIIETNQVFRDMIGYTEEELLKITYKMLTPDKWHAIENEIVETQINVRNYSDVYEKEYIKKDGTVFPVELRAFLLKDRNNNKVAIWGLVRDITERKKSEERIELQNEELQRINAEKDKFFSIVAHDLRGPFTGFLGFTDILKKDLQSIPINDLKVIADDLNKSANHLFGFLTNLLEWSKTKMGLTAFNPKKLSLKKIGLECINLYDEAAKRKRILIEEKIPEDIFVFADIAMLHTILGNLISNAIKFTKKDGRIIISANENNNKVQISVEDTGIGLSVERINDLFKIDKKTSREGTDKEPSSGIGLLLCKEFIEKHNGEINVESEEGKWSKFTVSFNLQQ